MMMCGRPWRACFVPSATTCAALRRRRSYEAGPPDVDCAIVDVSLAGLSGFDLRERLRGRTPPTPVVMMTGDGDWLARNRSRGVDIPVVSKPFEPATLETAIAAAVTTRVSP